MLVVIDPGHGGTDPGAVYNGRQEKDDVLALAKAVGKLLEAKGVDVVYTREGDIYETPFKKAQDGNSVNADYFVSFHRNSSEYPNQYSGAEVLVYSDTGVRSTLADNILDGMEQAGFKNLGIKERKDLVVLRRTKMPAVLIEAGFLNNDKDNRKFDENFDELARGIANGILKTLGYSTYGKRRTAAIESEEQMTESSALERQALEPQALEPQALEPPYPMESMIPGTVVPSEGMTCSLKNNRYGVRGSEKYDDGDAEIIEKRSERVCNCQCQDVLYRVQVGAFRNKDSADRLLNSLLIEEFPAFIVYDDGLYKVQVGAYHNLSNAISMEYKLRQYRYNTYITTK